MSFTVVVKAEQGTATIVNAQNVPDGTYEVSGHEDATRTDLMVVRRTPDGRYHGQAASTHYKEA